MTTIKSYCFDGRSMVPASVTCEITSGIGIHLVGLNDQDTKESLLRTVTALVACGYKVPGKKIVITVSPTMPQRGPVLDLPIALAVIAESGQMTLRDDIDRWTVWGALGLDGTVREVFCPVTHLKTTLCEGKKLMPTFDYEFLTSLKDETFNDIYPANNLKEAIAVLSKH